MLFKKIVFPYIPESYGRYLTAGKEYELAGLNEAGIACIIADDGTPWPLDDGFGVRDPEYKVTE